MDDYSNSALLIIDVQNDFCPGGKLAVKDGDRIIPVINGLMKSFPKVVATQDWHPKDHLSFASNHPGKEILETAYVGGVEQFLWPDHCIQGSEGADFHSKLNMEYISMILRKGMNKEIDSYSAFFENDKKTSTGLDGYLKNLNIDTLYLTGLATDYCVYYTVLDALKLGYRTNLFMEGVKGVNSPEGSVEKALEDMEEKGVKIIK